MNDVNPYYSTRQTARILGLSVGTVQRMVASGALQAYTTQGGHRRILASSVRHYCQARGVPTTGLLPAGDRVCIAHSASLPAQVQQALAGMAQVVLVSHPLELTGLSEDCAAFFIDARLGWLDWPDLHRPAGLEATARFIVYHAESLPPEQRTAISRHAQLHPGELSVELIEGFLLGLRAEWPEPPEPMPPGAAPH